MEPFTIDELDRAVAAGADRLVVAGGDGSIAPVAAAAGRAETPLACCPRARRTISLAGWAFRRQMGPAARLAARGTEVKQLELGWMDDRPFVNVASAGLPGPAARTAKAWKKPLGPLGYAAGALLAGITARAVSVEVSCDEGAPVRGRRLAGDCGRLGGLRRRLAHRRSRPARRTSST